ncbi:MAG: PatB family C-S lyase [Bacteroidales bacterium]|nr:PatB family C-S lyase [Bacteroidales bacterium]
MKYNFDTTVNRENSNCVKYDLRKAVFGNPDVLPMWVADMDFETPDFAREAVMERAKHPIYGYHFKDRPYYNAIQGWLLRHHQWEMPTEWMSFVPGVVCGFNMAVMAFTQEGDEVIIQSPVYPPFHHAVTGHGRKLVYNKLKIGVKGYEMDFDLLEKQAQTAKMLILCNPHNPVGRCWTREELERLSEICLRNDVMVISDEIHCDLVLPGYRHTPFATLGPEVADRCIVFHAASKTFNLAGLATSTAIIPNKAIRDTYNKYVEAMEAHLGNIFGKVATQASMEKGDEWLCQLLDYVQGNVDYVSDFLLHNLQKVRFFKPQATYMMWLDFNGYGLSEEELWRKMTQEAQLGFNRGSDFGRDGSGFFRVNLACPRAIVEEAMRRLKTVF